MNGSITTKALLLLKRFLAMSDRIPNKTQPIISIVFFGTFMAICFLILMLLLSVILLQNNYALGRVLVALGILLYLSITFLFIRRGRFTIASWLLIVLFGVIASYILIVWSINAPVGILTLGFVIFLSGVLFGSRYIIPVTISAVLVLFIIQVLNSVQVIIPDRSSLAVESGLGDVGSYGTIFGIFALIAIIAGRQKEEALRKVQLAELELSRQKDLLEVRLEERTRSLKEAQLQEIHQLHRFAELGQLTTVILHELANNLSILNLDIDSLRDRHKNSSSINRAQESIKYLDLIVDRVRQQLKQKNKNIRFNALLIIREAIDTLRPKLSRHNIKLETHEIQTRKSFYIFGDPLRLSQTLIILINNSIDAYQRSTTTATYKIDVFSSIKDNSLIISVLDYGPGIPNSIRSNLFKPLDSSKENGLGIGLFIARQIVETHFRGSLQLNPTHKYTEFIISLPNSNTTPPKPPKHSPPGT